MAELRRLHRAGLAGGLDAERLIEEVEAIGLERILIVDRQVGRAMEYLLRLECSPDDPASRAWQCCLRRARVEAGRRLSPSVREPVEARLTKLFDQARYEVHDTLETMRDIEALDRLPWANPCSLGEILDPDWWRQGVAITPAP